MRFTEGRAWVVGCPRCDHPVLEAHCEGVKVRLSTKSVPLKDAMVLSKYSRILCNVHIGVTQLYVSAWHGSYGRPSRGRIYMQHICGARN